MHNCCRPFHRISDLLEALNTSTLFLDAKTLNSKLNSSLLECTQSCIFWHVLSLIMYLNYKCLVFDCLLYSSRSNVFASKITAMYEIFEKTLQLTLVLIFLWWSAQAFTKYLSEPTTTSVYHTFGEDGQKFTFPLISICNFNFVKENTYLQTCTNASNLGFISSMEKCISMTHKTFSSKDFYDSLEEEIPITDISIEFEGQYHSIPSNYLWGIMYHERYGYCHVLDIHKLKTYQILS